MAHFSQVYAVSGGQVKLADDMWLVRSGALAPAQTAWAVKNGTLTKVWERRGGPVSMTILTPAPNASVRHDFALSFQVQVPKINGARLGAQMRFQGRFDETHPVDEATGICTATVHFNQENPTVTISLISDNGYTAAPLTYTADVYGGNCDVVMTAPAYDQAMYGPLDITWTARAMPNYGEQPLGTIRFDGPRSEVQFVATDANGYASATFRHNSGERWCTAQFQDSTNGFSPNNAAFGRIRLLINTRYQQVVDYTYAGHRNYAGANAGPSQTSTIISGENTDGKNWRAFTMLNRPAKPQSDAYCVAAFARYRPGLTTPGVRIGYHTFDSYPATGTFGNGVQQNLAIGPGSTQDHWVDMSLNLAAVLNNGTLRGLVYGGPAGETPLAILQSVAYNGLTVTWEWWRWIDT